MGQKQKLSNPFNATGSSQVSILFIGFSFLFTGFLNLLSAFNLLWLFLPWGYQRRVVSFDLAHSPFKLLFFLGALFVSYRYLILKHKDRVVPTLLSMCVLWSIVPNIRTEISYFGSINVFSLPSFLVMLHIYLIYEIWASAASLPSKRGSGDRTPGYEGLRGWLILPGLGLIVGFIINLLGFLGHFGHHGYSNFDYELSTSLAQVVLGIWMIVATVHFFLRTKKTPIAMIGLLIANVVISFLLLMFFSANQMDEYTGRAGVQSVISMITAIIWISYFKKSKRVKATFVN